MSKELLKSEFILGKIIPNIAQMLRKNVRENKDVFVFKERKNGKYIGIRQLDFYRNIRRIAYNLTKKGFEKGDKIVILSRNRREMLEFELAVQASGGITVPLFFNLKKEVIERLTEHSDANFIIVGGQKQLDKIRQDFPVKKIFVFDNIIDKSFPDLVCFDELIQNECPNDYNLDFDADQNDICLNMYTSGTMGVQKCVQLSHRNILSQQTALDMLWNIDKKDRFLSYLPWHHSFGGIFEKFSALYNCAEMYLESGYGVNPKVIMENWKIVKPTIFFSVPLVYQALYSLAKEDKEAEKLFFHKDLKFVFTAAAPLPKNISDEFEKRNVRVIEGWGLTETTPCCTITSPNEKRVNGVVGKPIPGVTIKISNDSEILVKGPNVMRGYYKNDKANDKVLSDDGWFSTGDIGEITKTGLKLIARKDRIFKLLNAEKIVPSDIEKKILGKCSYLSYVLVEGSGRRFPVALLFPNKALIDATKIDDNEINIENCRCPKKTEELSDCLKKCLKELNNNVKEKFARINSALLINNKLSIEDKTLTASLKMKPNGVKHIYKAHIEKLYDENVKIREKVYIINIEK